MGGVGGAWEGRELKYSEERYCVYHYMIWIHTAYDCADNLKIKKYYDREMRV